MVPCIDLASHGWRVAISPNGEGAGGLGSWGSQSPCGIHVSLTGMEAFEGALGEWIETRGGNSKALYGDELPSAAYSVKKGGS